MAVSGNFSITNLDTPLTGGFSHRLTSIAAEGGREGGQGSTQKPGFLGYCDTVPGILCTVLLLGCMHAHSSSSSSSLQWKKLTAPEGVPGRSPTLVLTRPCAASLRRSEEIPCIRHGMAVSEESNIPSIPEIKTQPNLFHQKMRISQC